MAKVIQAPATDLIRENHGFPGGIAFLVMVLVSIALWAALIAFIA